MKRRSGLGLIICAAFATACEDVGDADGSLPDLGAGFDAGPIDVGPFDVGPFDLGPIDLGFDPDATVSPDATVTPDGAEPDAAEPDAAEPDAEPDDLGPPDTGCPDADQDTICDSADVCAAGDDRVDNDGDGVPDACDPCPLDNPDDPDSDGVCTSNDLCFIGDDGLDADKDTVPDACDLCPAGDDLQNIDGDNAPDACDPCPLDLFDDADTDGSCDSDDVCPGFDDALDFDLDLVPDGCDNCPVDPNPLQEDTRGIAAFPITFQTVTASTATVALALADDDVSAPVPIGFAFDYFGQPVTQLVISSNGFVSFDPIQDSGCCAGYGIPYTDGINNVIGLAWTDLNPSNGGLVRYTRAGIAPLRRFVLEYNAVPWYGGGAFVTVTLVLYEGTSRVEIYSADQPPGRLYTRGVEGPGGLAAAYIRDERNADFGLVNDGVGFETDPLGPDGVGDACDNYDDVQFAGSGSGSGSGVVVE